jgi:hypothetical protein
MGGFDKIEFTPVKEKQSLTAKQSLTDKKGETFDMGKRSKKRGFKFSKNWTIALGVLVVILVLTAIPAFATYKSGLQTYREAKLIKTALDNQDITLAIEQVAKTKKSLAETQKNFHYLIPYKFVPVINFYYNDVDHMMQAGSHGLDTATTSLKALEPYVDVLGLKGEGTFTGGSAEDRIRTAVMAASKITPQIDEIGESLVLVQKEMNQVDPGHYPPLIFGKKIQEQLTLLKQIVNDSATGITEAKPLIKALPSLLGETEEKKYLVIFQNDKELRPTGGFMTAYAIFRIDKGVIHIDRSDDIYKLDDSVPSKPKAPAFLSQ